MDEMKEHIIIFIIFIVISTAIFILLINGDANKKLNITNKAIADCEKYLPRDQHCEAVITARVKQ